MRESKDDWDARGSRQPLLQDVHSNDSYDVTDPIRPQISRRHHSDSRQPSDLDKFLGIGDEAREPKPRLLSDDGARSGAAAAAAAAAAGVERGVSASLNDGVGTGANESEADKSGGAVRRRNAILFFVVLIVNVLAPLILKVSADIYTVRYAFYNLQMSSFAYDIVVLSVLLHKMYFTDEITPKMRAFPKRRFLLMACFDASSSFLSAIGSPGTPASATALFGQLQIPFNMIFSRLLMHTQYKRAQVVGGTLCFLGCALAVLPLFTDGSSADVRVSSIILVLLSYVPMSMSFVYKETQLKAHNLNVFYLTTWVSCLQIPVQFLLVPLESLPGLDGVKLSSIPESFSNGARCMVNTALVDPPAFCNATAQAANACGDTPLPPDCANAGWIFVVFVVFLVALNVFGLTLVKYCSAVLLALSNAMALPVQNLMFSASVASGPAASAFNVPLTWEDGVGLAIVLAGLLLYNELLEPLGRALGSMRRTLLEWAGVDEVVERNRSEVLRRSEAYMPPTPQRSL